MTYDARVAISVLLVLASLTGSIYAQEVRHPNILIIWGDDVGIWNISAYHRGMMGGSTPNIDRIGNEGVIFMDSYGEPSRTAGRAAFITGQYPVRTGLTTVGLPGSPLGLQKQDPTIAELLKPLGYATGQFGKNHLGGRDEHLPTVHGFDEFYGFLYHLNAFEYPTGYDYPKDTAFRKQNQLRGVIHSFANPDGTQRVQDTGLMTVEQMKTFDEDVTQRSIDFIDQSVKANKPFFVWTNFSRMHIHTHLSSNYDGKTGYGLYADGVAEMDDNVGALLKALDDRGLANNTIVMFSTDNGAAVMSWPDGGNTPFKGEKGLSWEGAYRVPMLVRWPGHIRPGSVTGEFIAMEDWMPTLVDAAGGGQDIAARLLGGYKAGRTTYKVHVDGYDQMDMLTGAGPSKRKEFFYFAETSLQAVRYEDWKLVFVRQDKWFQGTREKLNTPIIENLKLDPFERFTESRGYDEWQENRAYLLGPSTQLIQKFLATFKDYPARQKGVNFDINEIVNSATQGGD